MTASTITTELLRHGAAYDFVRDSDAARSPTEFSSPEWTKAAWNHLSPLGDPAVLLAGDGSGWCALALASKRDRAGERLSLAGAPLGDEHDVVHSAGADVERLVPALVRACEQLADGQQCRLELSALAAHGLLARELPSRSEQWRVRREAAPVIDVERVRVDASSHRRRLRRLGREGAVAFRVIDAQALTAEEVAAFTSRRLQSWSERGRIYELPPVERLSGFCHFMGAAVGLLAQRGWARLRVLEVDGARAAESLHLGPAHRPLMYMISYSPRFASFSPGRVLFEHTLFELGEAMPQLRTGRGDEQYKLAAGAGDEWVISAHPTFDGRG